MRKLLVLALIPLAVACTNKNASAHSAILDWDIPQSVSSENPQLQELLGGIAVAYDMKCGETETFDLIEGSNHLEEFKSFLDQKGYKNEEIAATDTSSAFAVIGPSDAMVYVSPKEFAVCEL